MWHYLNVFVTLFVVLFAFCVCVFVLFFMFLFFVFFCRVITCSSLTTAEPQIGKGKPMANADACLFYMVVSFVASSKLDPSPPEQKYTKTYPNISKIYPTKRPPARPGPGQARPGPGQARGRARAEPGPRGLNIFGDFFGIFFGRTGVQFV